jgi:hypothetical protein
MPRILDPEGRPAESSVVAPVAAGEAAGVAEDAEWTLAQRIAAMP